MKTLRLQRAKRPSWRYLQSMEAVHAAECLEQVRLAEEVRQATTRYTRAVAELAINMGTLPEPAYSIAKANVEQSRADAESARESLLLHRKEHGC